MGKGLEPLAQRLRSAGYETYGRSDGSVLAADFGFGLGFDVYDANRREWAEHQSIGWEPELERIRARKSERCVEKRTR